MNTDTLTEAEAVAEAKSFFERAVRYELAVAASAFDSNGYTFHSECPRESGALRRASLDLTRALADMRRR